MIILSARLNADEGCLLLELEWCALCCSTHTSPQPPSSGPLAAPQLQLRIISSMSPLSTGAREREKRERTPERREEMPCFFTCVSKLALWKNTAASAFSTSLGSFHCTLRSIWCLAGCDGKGRTFSLWGHLSKIQAFSRLYFLQNDNLIPPKPFYNHSSVSVKDHLYTSNLKKLL